MVSIKMSRRQVLGSTFALGLPLPMSPTACGRCLQNRPLGLGSRGRVF